MMRYAFTSGLDIPSSLADQLKDLSRPQDSEEPAKVDTDNKKSPGDSPPVRRLTSEALIQIHIGLARVISPATPRSIMALTQKGGGLLAMLGPVALIRQMVLLAVFSLVAFVVISLSSRVSIDNINQSLLQHSGLNLLFNQIFLLSAAALGASFANLFEANRYVTKGTFDPVYNSSYWVRFILGMIAGLILAEVVSSQLLSSAAGADGDASSLLTDQPMTKPILALLGGFSSDLVFRILGRLVTGVESMLRGDPRDVAQNQAQAARDSAKMDADREKMELASGLADLKGKLGDGKDPEELKEGIQKIMDQMTARKK
ncbi:MAG: hypothetical protein QNK37_05005 [Acidobacteriota bacterium]|nr:hypothetical protein [Acidobacteriota bacterium]